MTKLSFIGTCENDKDWKKIAEDTTELAQIVENGKEITEIRFRELVFMDQFIEDKLIKLKEDDYEENLFFFYNSKKKIAFFWNCVDSVHFFFCLI